MRRVKKTLVREEISSDKERFSGTNLSVRGG